MASRDHRLIEALLRLEDVQISSLSRTLEELVYIRELLPELQHHLARDSDPNAERQIELFTRPGERP